jgi:hypothetical protein
MMGAVGMIESRFGIQLKRVARDEWAGPCPFCGGDDRWHFWEGKNNWWCRPGIGHCGQKGFLDDLFDELKRPTEEQLLEWRVAKLERQQREQEERLAKLEKMAQCTDHLLYHQALTNEALDYWFGEGIFQESIDRYLLGYCDRCPTDRAHRPSFTIPIINAHKLENIRHRLKGADSDKYRPHIAGLGSQLFNADALETAQDSIIVTEGEKKTIVLDQSGFPSVGISGKRNFKREWLTQFNGIRTIYIALDPDAVDSAYRLGGIFGERARVVHLPTKIDDMIVKYGANSNDIEAFLKLARPVGDNGYAKAHRN